MDYYIQPLIYKGCNNPSPSNLSLSFKRIIYPNWGNSLNLNRSLGKDSPSIWKRILTKEDFPEI